MREEGEDDALPRLTRRGHAKLRERLDDDALERAAERERVDAGRVRLRTRGRATGHRPLPDGSSQEADLAQRGLTDDEAR